MGQYFSARHNQYRVVFTDNAKSMLKTANDTSYNTALALNARSEAEIKARLESIGFKRSLTINQLNNLKKISHLPGAATFSVPGAGKTTEVKASTYALGQAVFHVTSHEWNVALTSRAYVFHLWCLSDSKKMLAVISPDELLPYIPTNNLEGKWESAKIPFSCFEGQFVEIA